MLYKTKSELVGEKKYMCLVLLPKMKLVLRHHYMKIEKKMRKSVFLLVSIMRCSYKSLMTGKIESTEKIFSH